MRKTRNSYLFDTKTITTEHRCDTGGVSAWTRLATSGKAIAEERQIFSVQASWCCRPV
jgi:hypothetical protein